ncbi:MAG: sel1 repeat family protein [Erysipelotrichaceae bacterium]|nr:sel1 repeat family protein [Erysipelotrichaceae bacterium]
MFENDEKLLEKAKNDYNGRNYNSAVKKLQKLAKKQNAEAYYLLGEIYLTGGFQNHDTNQALKYYELSAQKGYLDAIITLGDLYSNEKNSCYNIDKALPYLKIGADNDQEFCLFKLGHIAGCNRDYQNAIKYFDDCMHSKNCVDNSYKAESAFRLGNMYSRGLGVEKNDQKFFEYYQKAANYGHKEALYTLAQCYRYGYIVDKDIENAKKYYKLASENGNYEAMNEYGLWCYDELDNKAEGKEYFKKAIEYCEDYDIDFVEPYFNIAKHESVRYAGEHYEEVIEGLEYKQSQNKELTQKEMDMYIESLYELANMYHKDYSFWNSLGKKKSSDSDKMKAIFTAEELAEHDQLIEKEIYENTFIHDDQKAISLYEKAGYLGHNESLCQLAIFYKDGKYKDSKALMSDKILDMIKDKITFDDVIKMRTLADDQLNGYAKSMVGYCYEKGVGVLLRDESVAFDYISEAARLGNAFGMYELGMMYNNKNSLMKDYQKAFNYFEKAANRGHVESMNMLGCYYKSGNYSIAQNYQEAFKWFSKSAARNDPYGCYELALMYLEGLGMSQDSDKACYYFEKAANKGYKKAQEELDKMKV